MYMCMYILLIIGPSIYFLFNSGTLRIMEVTYRKPSLLSLKIFSILIAFHLLLFGKCCSVVDAKSSNIKICTVIRDDQEKWSKVAMDCKKVTKPNFKLMKRGQSMQEFDFDDNVRQQNFHKCIFVSLTINIFLIRIC